MTDNGANVQTSEAEERVRGPLERSALSCGQFCKAERVEDPTFDKIIQPLFDANLDLELQLQKECY
jgi:hypothetical protein